jgi:4-hydroxybenzoyl-CoA thioesterase
VLTIESTVTDVKEKTFTVQHVVRNGEREALAGREIRIWGIVHPDDPQKLKAMPLPADVLRALGVSLNCHKVSDIRRRGKHQ